MTDRPEAAGQSKGSERRATGANISGNSSQATKAKLLLKLIKNGSIPKPPEAFMAELASLAGRESGKPASAQNGGLESLTRHLKSLTQFARPVEQTEQSSSQNPKQKKECTAPKETGKPQKQPELISTQFSLKDQHPAVIKQHFDTLPNSELSGLQRGLPGETARQVALLAWQRKA